jgi:hypothetical protein
MKAPRYIKVAIDGAKPRHGTPSLRVLEELSPGLFLTTPSKTAMRRKCLRDLIAHCGTYRFQLTTRQGVSILSGNNPDTLRDFAVSVTADSSWADCIDAIDGVTFMRLARERLEPLVSRLMPYAVAAREEHAS